MLQDKIPLSARRQLYAVLGISVLLRVLLFGLTSIPQHLERRPELSTPLTSFRSLREGVYIWSRGTNPYEGGVFHHSPIYLFLFTYLVPASSYVLTAAWWILIDVISALSLVHIWRGRSVSSDKAIRREALIAALYLFNPYTLMTCLARSTTALDNTLILAGLAAVSSKSTKSHLASLILLALAAQASFYPILLLPPWIMYLRQHQPKSQTWYSTLRPVVVYSGSFLGIVLLNTHTLGQSWISSTWGVILGVSDLTPNVGMWWYFFTEMFDHFRSFFLGAFQLHLVIYVLPICLRLQHEPLHAILVLVGVMGTWKSYPTLGDLGLFAGLLACFPEIVSNLRHPLFTLTVYLYTLILLPLLHSLWLLTGTGNANFFYAATMVHGLNSSLAIVDVLSAALRVQVKKAVTAAEQSTSTDTGTGSRSLPDAELDMDAIDKAWTERGWEVVRLNSSS